MYNYIMPVPRYQLNGGPIDGDANNLFLRVRDTRDDRVIFEFNYDKKLSKYLPFDKFCDRVQEFLNYENFADKTRFVFEHILNLPFQYLCICLCNFKIPLLKSYVGARLCRMSSPTFIRYKTKMKIYTNYLLYYYKHKKQVDQIIRSKLIMRNTKKKRKYNIFMELLFNPFQNAAEVAKKFDNINEGNIRHYILQSCSLLEDTPMTEPILKPFMKIRYGDLKVKIATERQLLR